ADNRSCWPASRSAMLNSPEPDHSPAVRHRKPQAGISGHYPDFTSGGVVQDRCRDTGKIRWLISTYWQNIRAHAAMFPLAKRQRMRTAASRGALAANILTARASKATVDIVTTGAGLRSRM